MSAAIHEYLFDVKLFASIRVKAANVEAARAMLREHVNCASANFGAWPNGDPIVAEASVDDDELPCVERDGEDFDDNETDYALESENRLRLQEAGLTSWDESEPAGDA